MQDQSKPMIRFHVELEIDGNAFDRVYRLMMVTTRIIILIIVLVKLLVPFMGTYVA